MEAAKGLFTTEMITSITTALQTAIGNVLENFISLLPVLAIMAGVGFGIRMVLRLFRRYS